MGNGYRDNFNLELVNLSQEPDLPATRVHLTVLPFNTEEPSSRCSFTENV